MSNDKERNLDSLLSFLTEIESQKDNTETIDVEPLLFDNNIYITLKKTRQVVKFKLMRNVGSMIFVYDGIFGQFGVVRDVIVRADVLLVALVSCAMVECDESLIRFIVGDESFTKIAENEMSKYWIIKEHEVRPTWMDGKYESPIIEIFDTASLSTN